ncbi:hypothetical protein [Streptomyces resistomycificus]|uniref:Uncharacterized protein n=1 Tax=Streptomyces resistomycificus TaxID=67356 RepID=A0A0L8L5C9_9ACTN|nr:hypothetical protein [Streptomyces resistomycificus]KOG33304.1 hypothetical protein ADK37_23275 [Streptomyces resistomycificus]KUN99508.1 hypothetical protein AQJ84_11210 [Streptomyces resistomycificus]
MAHGSRRFTVLDHAARLADTLAHAARIFITLATRQASWSLTDLYAAAAAARFTAAHHLIERAETQLGNDPEADLIQIRQPLWFGATTIHEETDA